MIQTGAKALAALEADLNARINPERSRLFDRKRLEASRQVLFELSLHAWPELTGERISVVGSNGKGSTAWFLAGLLESPERTLTTAPVGLYTSPHLRVVLERIRLNREPLNAQQALAELERLRDILPEYADYSYFEILTLLALNLFHTRRCPAQIFEAGLGGRFDATRIARAQTVVLTRIDLEHTKILGDTHQAILREKLGIITPDCRDIFYGPQAHLSDDEIQTQIQGLAPAARIHVWRPATPGGYSDYLAENLAFARFILKTLNEHTPIADAAHIEGVANIAPPPGRLEIRALRLTTATGMSGEPSPRSVPACYDVAHNPASIARALQDVRSRPEFSGFRRGEVHLGVLNDRDVNECMAAARSAGFENVRLLRGPELAPAPGLPALDPPPAGVSVTGAPGIAADTEFLVVLGSHRIYNYFVELTAGPEKTDRDEDVRDAGS